MRAIFLAVLAILSGADAASAQESMDTPPQAGGRGMMGQMDANHDGVITREEYMAAHARADTYFAKLDADKDGAVTREEFMAEPAGPKRSERFKQLDTNGDGRITREELNARRTARFDMMDANHDGKLTAEEVRTARAALRRKGPAAQ